MNAKSRNLTALPQRMLAELLVIVAGVLIALAIDEWRTDVENSNLADVYLRQIIADLRTTEEALETAGPVTPAAKGAAKELLSLFEDKQQADLEQVRGLLHEMLYFDNPVPVLGNIEALISTGDLKLIRNPTIRVKITEYLSFSRDFLLEPLSDIEDSHRHLYGQIETLAARYGIAPLGAGSPSIGGHDADVAGFLENSDAFATIARINRLKFYFDGYNSTMSDKTTELRTLLEATIHSK